MHAIRLRRALFEGHSLSATISHGTIFRIAADRRCSDDNVAATARAARTRLAGTLAADISHKSISASTIWLYAYRASRFSPAIRP